MTKWSQDSVSELTDLDRLRLLASLESRIAPHDHARLAEKLGTEIIQIGLQDKNPLVRDYAVCCRIRIFFRQARLNKLKGFIKKICQIQMRRAPDLGFLLGRHLVRTDWAEAALPVLANFIKTPSRADLEWGERSQDMVAAALAGYVGTALEENAFVILEHNVHVFMNKQRKTALLAIGRFGQAESLAERAFKIVQEHVGHENEHACHGAIAALASFRDTELADQAVACLEKASKDKRGWCQRYALGVLDYYLDSSEQQHVRQIILELLPEINLHIRRPAAKILLSRGSPAERQAAYRVLLDMLESESEFDVQDAVEALAGSGTDLLIQDLQLKDSREPGGCSVPDWVQDLAK